MHVPGGKALAHTLPRHVGKQLQPGGRMGALAADIIRRKALDLIVGNVDIKDEAKPA